MLDLIWNLFQQDDIDRLQKHRAQQAAEQDEKFAMVERQARSAESRLLELERRHEQLKLVTLAMWQLLSKRNDLTEADLRKAVESTDLVDGDRDGRADLTSGMVKCSRCGRSGLNTATVCAYCGARNTAGTPFAIA